MTAAGLIAALETELVRFKGMLRSCNESVVERADRIDELEAEVGRLRDIPKPAEGDWVEDIQATYMCAKYGCTDRRERIKYREKYEVDVSKFTSITLKFAEDCEAAEAREAKLREAAGFMMGWHPTDPEHPAFMETSEYGTAMMLLLLSDEPYSTERMNEVFQEYLLKNRTVLVEKADDPA